MTRPCATAPDTTAERRRQCPRRQRQGQNTSCKRSSDAVSECLEFSSEIKLFFPKDGHQPTAAEAIQWSCANIDDEAVTNLYPALFGSEEREKAI